MRQNTLVFFTGDNGMNMGHHGIWGKGNGTFPQNMYGTSVKVPAIWSHPGHIPAGMVAAELFSHYDVFPTLLDYLGVDNPPDERMPGRSFAGRLHGEAFQQRENVVIFDEYGPVRMIRSTRWKYIHRYPYGPHELYDLVNDPGERRNLVEDAASQPVIAEMKAELDDWFVRYAEPARDGSREPLKRAGLFNQAAAHFERAAQHPAYAVRGMAQMGFCFKRSSRREEAVASFQRAVQISSGSSNERVPILYLLGKTYECLGRTFEALETYRWIRRECPGYRDVADRIVRLSSRRASTVSGKPPAALSAPWAEDFLTTWWGILRPRK